jgi:membrane-associated PAP2 superfamily phosphatase
MLVCLFLVVGAGPLGWVVLAAAVVAVAGPGLYARRAGGNVAEACAYTFAAVMLSLPLPAVITLLVASWAGWGHWQ